MKTYALGLCGLGIVIILSAANQQQKLPMGLQFLGGTVLLLLGVAIGVSS